MEQVFSNVLKYNSIDKASYEIKKYINDRRKGILTSLKTRFERFNHACMGGIEPNTIYTIGGISGKFS